MRRTAVPAASQDPERERRAETEQGTEAVLRPETEQGTEAVLRPETEQKVEAVPRAARVMLLAEKTTREAEAALNPETEPRAEMALRPETDLSVGAGSPEKRPAEQEKEPEARTKEPGAETVRRGPFRFSMCGINPGEDICFINDSTKTARVVDDRHVEYEGQTTSLSALAQMLLGVKHTVQGPIFFTYNGKLLRDLRVEKEVDSDGKA